MNIIMIIFIVTSIGSKTDIRDIKKVGVSGPGPCPTRCHLKDSKGWCCCSTVLFIALTMRMNVSPVVGNLKENVADVAFKHLHTL